MSASTLHCRRRSQGGFTMPELVVAGFLGAMALVSAYVLFIAGSKQYYVQEQIVQMQEGMRFALEYMKTDLSNAGRLSVVNAIGTQGGPGDVGRDPQFCSMRGGLQAVQLFEDDDDIPAVLTRNGNNLSPDRLRLLSDATGAVPLSVSRVAGRRIYLGSPLRQRTDEARRMVETENAFTSIFKPGFYLYVASASGRSDMVPISAVTFDAEGPFVELSEGLCPLIGGGSMAADCFGGSCLAAPVQLVEYAVIEDPENEEKTNLVRRVIDARIPSETLPDTELVISEYAVDFQVWGMYDTRPSLAASGAQPTIAKDEFPTDDMGNIDADSESLVLNVRPQRLRALNLMLAIRSPREDETFLTAADMRMAPEDRLPADRTWFELTEREGSGFARVVTMRADVETPNLYRGLP